MTVTVSFEHVSKEYRLGQVGTGTISHDLERLWAQLRGKPDPFARVGMARRESTTSGDDFVWALRDVTFDICEGEVFGIIGRNGAGKSTLLKVLSRITAPTLGRIRARGRISSLLEVGTGFHPDLTGRENIYLNGTILGMQRREVAARFDEIIEFSGCAKYVDTPVKRYSSGMTVRLGFAVAAHLQCEVLVVDEVLAVGDASFQKKCIDRMTALASDGRTILFVSHNMQAVEQLCTRACVIEAGAVAMIGDVNAAIAEYFDSFTTVEHEDAFIENKSVRRTSGIARFASINVLNADGVEPTSFRKGEKVRMKFRITVSEQVPRLCVVVRFLSGMTREEVTSVKHMVTTEPAVPGDKFNLEIELDTRRFRPGIYPLYYWLGDPDNKLLGYDTIDAATLPLVISDDSAAPSRGVFDVGSRLVQSQTSQ
jgi:lipopolysaccharide transport system ATP-binding protein